MDIWNALRRAGREDITIRSIIAKTIRDIYNREVPIKSVKIHGKKVIIKTGKPVINSELNLISQDIQKAALTTLSNIWIKLSVDTIFLFQ